MGLTARNSTSLQRAPGPPSTSVKGEATHYPFWPGGLQEPELVRRVTERPPELSLGLENGETPLVFSCTCLAVRDTHYRMCSVENTMYACTLLLFRFSTNSHM